MENAPDAPATNTAVTESDPKPDVPRASWIWIKDTSGYPSVTVTFLTIAFWLTSVWFVLSMFSKVGPIVIRPFDPMAAGAYLGPIIAMYYGRKNSDLKYNNFFGTGQK